MLQTQHTFFIFQPVVICLKTMFYSVIIPVYNRPEEVNDLLESLTCQRYKNFEVIVVEDGSSVPCKEVVERYAGVLDIHYFVKRNSGPGQTRNYGVERSNGAYMIILDSDCILPPGYFEEVEQELEREPSDVFGGPDRADESFTTLQKAINYSMTSFFTTGGIRGGKKRVAKYFPRSFNMGVRKSVYEALGGFSEMRVGEDIDLSTRVHKVGYSCRLFPRAWVYHKRRSTFGQFFRQVYSFGKARIYLYKKHPGTLKLVHLLPAVFTLGIVLLLIASLFCIYALLPVLLFVLIIFTDSAVRNRSLSIGVYSVATAFIQLTGYGSGFWVAWWKYCVLPQKQE